MSNDCLGYTSGEILSEEAHHLAGNQHGRQLSIMDDNRRAAFQRRGNQSRQLVLALRPHGSPHVSHVGHVWKFWKNFPWRTHA